MIYPVACSELCKLSRTELVADQGVHYSISSNVHLDLLDDVFGFRVMWKWYYFDEV